MRQQSPRAQHRRLGPIAAALALSALALLALRSPREAPVRAQSEQTGAVQNLWIVTSAHVQNASGASTDLAEALRSAVSLQLDPPVQFSPTLTYQKSETVGGRATAAGGATLANVAVQLGLLTVTNSDGSTASVVAALATPSEQAHALGLRDQVAIDLSSIPAAQPGETADISYAFLQVLAPADTTAEAGLAGEQVLGQRYQAGAGQLLSATDADGNEQPAVTPPLPLTVQSTEQRSNQALYLRANQRGGVEGVYEALGALALDPAQLLPVPPATQPGEPAGFAPVRGVAKGSTLVTPGKATANQGLGDGGDAPPTAAPTDAPTAGPSPSPSPTPPPMGICGVTVDCVYSAVGFADDHLADAYTPGSKHWEFGFQLVLHAPDAQHATPTLLGSGGYTEMFLGAYCTISNAAGELIVDVTDLKVSPDGRAEARFTLRGGTPGSGGYGSCTSPNTGYVLPTQINNFYTFFLDPLPLEDGAMVSGTVDPNFLYKNLAETASIAVVLHYSGVAAPGGIPPP